MKGTVKFFNAMKGFGFIAAEDGKEYFVHQTGLEEGVTLHDNDSVEFDVEQGDRGPKAVNVKKVQAGAEAEAEPEAEEEGGSED
jgi:CspA family cold shock protein